MLQNLWRMANVTPDMWLPSQPLNTVPWLILISCSADSWRLPWCELVHNKMVYLQTVTCLNININQDWWSVTSLIWLTTFLLGQATKHTYAVSVKLFLKASPIQLLQFCCYWWFWFHYWAPVGLRSIVMSMSVCLSAHITQKPCGRTSPTFCACCLWPYLDPSLTLLRYIMYFWFYGWRNVFMPWEQYSESLKTCLKEVY